jgi:5-methyltetrahydrofolate--homocysteine methyltransferase
MSGQLLASMRAQILAFDEEELLKTIDDALNVGISPADIIAKGLSPGLDIVGSKFQQGEFFLPELMLGGEIMKRVLHRLRPHMSSSDAGPSRRVLIGTVAGDIHHIGKNIVAAVLEGAGYEVHDLGEDVPPVAFLNKAEELDVDVVGMSALISLSVSKMAETIAVLRDKGIRARIVVGGAALTERNARAIGADAFGCDAWQGLKIIRTLTDR